LPRVVARLGSTPKQRIRVPMPFAAVLAPANSPPPPQGVTNASSSGTSSSSSSAHVPCPAIT
jgi:hypothetical protein